MYCSKCGKELEEGIHFCPNCGQSLQPSEITNPSVEFKENKYWYHNILEYFLPLDNIKKWLISTMVLLLLNPLLGVFPCVYTSCNILGIDVYSERQSVFDLISEISSEAPIFSFFAFCGVALIIAAEIFLFLPLVKKVEYAAKHTLLAKIASILSLVFTGTLAVLVICAGQVQWGVKTGLTFWGWILVFESIALVVVTFMFSKKLKEAMVKKEVDIQ